MSQAGFYIRSLNGVRTVAVMTVFIGHAAVAPPHWPGHVGVTIFFFLSGYLIVTLLRREHTGTGTIHLGKFYLRRALRILPPAYVAIALATILGALGVLSADTDFWGVLAEGLNFTNYYIVVHGREGLPPDTTQLWSLAVEEHYYLVVPALLILLLRRFNLRQVGWTLVACAAVVPFWRVALGLSGASFDRLYVSTDTRIDSLLAGSAMALLCNPALGDPLPGGQRAQSAMRWLPGVAVAVFIVSALVPIQAFRLSIADTIQYVCLVPIFWHIISRDDTLSSRVLNSRVFVWVGVLSYSIYLLHRIFLDMFEQLAIPAVLGDGLALAVTLAGAQLVHTLVEEPCARLRKQLEAKLPTSLDRPRVP